MRKIYRIRNEYIWGTVHVRCLWDKLREGRLRWHRHVRWTDERMGRRMLDMEPPGQASQRGRPKRKKTTWKWQRLARKMCQVWTGGKPTYIMATRKGESVRGNVQGAIRKGQSATGNLQRAICNGQDERGGWKHLESWLHGFTSPIVWHINKSIDQLPKMQVSWHLYLVEQGWRSSISYKHSGTSLEEMISFNYIHCYFRPVTVGQLREALI